MTDDETPPRARPSWIFAGLVLACAAAACAAHLQPAGPSPPRPTPTVTATPLAAPPTPMPTATAVTSPVARLEAPVENAEKAAAVADAPTEPAPALATGAVTLERRGDLFVAPARINGRALGDLLFDTGAGATFIDQRFADERQFPEIIAASTEGTRADGEVSIRELHGLSIGGVALATDRTFVVDLGSADALIGGRLAGVIGYPAFGPAPFTLDFVASTFTIHPDASFEPPASVQAEALRVDQGLPFVEATLADGTTVWLLLDSGSSAGLSVWRGFGKQHPGALRPVSPPATDASATATTAKSFELRSVRLLGEHYARIPVSVGDAPARPWQRTRVVGRVGMALLHHLRLTVHPATERIWVERP